MPLTPGTKKCTDHFGGLEKKIDQSLQYRMDAALKITLKGLSAQMDRRTNNKFMIIYTGILLISVALVVAIYIDKERQCKTNLKTHTSNKLKG